MDLVTIELVLGILVIVIGALVAVWKMSTNLVVSINNLNASTQQLTNHIGALQSDVKDNTIVLNNHETRITVLESINRDA